MGVKDEISQAKIAAGMAVQEIAKALNLEFEGFYYWRDGRLYRDSVPGAQYPLTAIL